MGSCSCVIWNDSDRITYNSKLTRNRKNTFFVSFVDQKFSQMLQILNRIKIRIKQTLQAIIQKNIVPNIAQQLFQSRQYLSNSSEGKDTANLSIQNQIILQYSFLKLTHTQVLFYIILQSTCLPLNLKENLDLHLQSGFDIIYEITGQHSHIVSAIHKDEINPMVELNIQGNIRIGGWRKTTQSQQQSRQNLQTYEVLAGRINTTGLNIQQMNKFFITVKAVIGKFQKVLIGNCPIKTVKDIRYKIRSDLSYRQIKQSQAQQLIKKAINNTYEDTSLNISPQRQSRRKQYLRALQNLEVDTQLLDRSD